MAATNQLIGETLLNLFEQKQMKPQKLSKPNVTKNQLEMALAVLLVEIAGSDQNFEQREYRMIAAGLKRIFGTSVTDISALVNQANVTLGNLRGTSTYAKLLNDNLSSEQRYAVMEVIDEVIMADGVEDGFETYLRHKFANILGVPLQALTPKSK